MSNKKYIDYLGNEFYTIKEMCEYYDISISTYFYRKNKGWSIEKILTNKSQKVPVFDFMGQEFKSEKEMCIYYGISQPSYRWRIRNGWSKKNALLIKNKSNICPCVDHMGNKFKSKTDMAKYYNISNKRLDARLKAGCSLKRALTEPLKEYSVIDYKGNTFESIEKMCEQYGIKSSVYKDRISRGWSLEDALLKRSKECYEIVDHKGVLYNSITECANTYDIPVKVLYSRLDLGWNMKTALETKPSKNISEYENIIMNYMDEHHIDYTHQFSICDCFSSGGKQSRFDFSVQNIGLIEVDGEGHFKQISNWNFNKAVTDDEIKTLYCETHNIPLLRIHYSQVKDNSYVKLIEDFIKNPCVYIKQHNKFLTEKEYYIERDKNLKMKVIT